jgi:polysaccharide biosynthesis transport protein
MDETNIVTQADTEYKLQDYYFIFIRHWLLVVMVAVIVFTLVATYSLTRPKLYKSAATFINETKSADLLSRYTMYEPNQREREIELYKALVLSQAFLEMFQSEIGSDTVLTGMNFAPAVIDKAAKSLELEVLEKTELLTLSVKAVDPIVAYRVAVLSLKAFSTRLRDIKLEETRRVVDYVEKQKEISGEQLEQTERSLQEFSKGAQFTLSTEESGLLKRLADLEIQLADIQTQRKLAEANLSDYDKRLAQLKVTNSPAFGEISSPEAKRIKDELERLMRERNSLLKVAGSAVQVADLDRNIDLKKQQLFHTILSESKDASNYSSIDQSTVAQISENRIKEELNLYVLKNRESYFRQLLQDYQRENPRLVERALEEARLKRSKSVYENLYNILLEKGEEARIQAATGSGGIRIIDNPSVPKAPIDANTTRNLSVGLLLGLGLGFGLAVVKEMMDHSFRSPEEVLRRLAIPVMGSVPIIVTDATAGRSVARHSSERLSLETRTNPAAWKKEDRDAARGYSDNLLSSLQPRNPIVDTYRTLRTNLQFASVDKPITSLLITSSIPGEGKTLTSANLAITFAEMGKRVLLLDGDMRKPRMYTVFNIDKAPGLSDLLVRDLELTKVIYPTLVPNLSIIPCGTVPPNPAEMIASQRMTDLIRKLESKYDLVLIDSPPVNVVTDAMLFANKVGHVLLVIKFAATNWRVAGDALANLRRSKINILGAILNGVILGRGYGYYYHSNYYKYYSEPAEKKG